jgi:hypothetical protein
MSTIIKSKARIFGETINSFELLQALKSPLLKDDDAPIQISTPRCFGWLSMVVICPHCNKLHFISSPLDDESYREKLIECKVLGDHNNKPTSTTKKELISILELLPDPIEIALEDIFQTSYLLTGVYKCSEECPVIHLDCAYLKDCLYQN